MIRIDAHQHFWKLARGDYGWLTPDLTAIYRDFLPEHIAPLLDRSGVARSVAVQAAPTHAETAFLLELARRAPFVAGVVGWTDLESVDAVARIETLAGDDHLLGLRPMLQDLPDDEWMLRSSIGPAIDALVSAGLCFDALVKPRHLPVLLRFLRRHPELAVVIDHAAKPPIASGAIEYWARHMRDIANHTQAFCKLSGLVTEAGADWNPAALEPYVEILLDAFGPRRLMWGSDWPVLHLAFEAPRHRTREPYGMWLDVAARLVDTCSDSDREWIFGRTAAEFYGLGWQPTSQRV